MNCTPVSPYVYYNYNDAVKNQSDWSILLVTHLW